MKYHSNSPEHKILRKNLRKSQTTAESLLWGHLRGKRFHGLKFYRQYGIEKYILDFYCHTKKMAIELDGSQHMEERQEKYDIERTRHLESLGIRVFRVWNNDVMTNMEGVLDGLYHEIFGETS